MMQGGVHGGSWHLRLSGLLLEISPGGQYTYKIDPSHIKVSCTFESNTNRSSLQQLTRRPLILKSAYQF